METFSAFLALCAGNSPAPGEFLARPVTRNFDVFFDLRPNKRINCWINNREAGDLRRHRAYYDVIVMDFHHKEVIKGAVTCAVCPESAWLVTFLIGNVSTGVVTWSALRCGVSGESGKKVAAAPLSKTAAAAAAAKTWFAKHPVDYMLHNRFPWKRSGRRSSMWPPYSLRRNLSAAACRPCDRSLMRIVDIFSVGVSKASCRVAGNSGGNEPHVSSMNIWLPYPELGIAIQVHIGELGNLFRSLIGHLVASQYRNWY